jgi:two-component system CheB/CheR fusion protein
VKTLLGAAMRDNRTMASQLEYEFQAGELRRVAITAEPVIRAKAPEYFLVSFRTLEGSLGPKISEPPLVTRDKGRDWPQVHEELRTLRLELQSTIEAFEATSEELKASNEEATAINEELQSSNEELETGKEELQSVNEELTTVNNQLQAKITQLEATTNDLANLLSSTDIAVLFLDSEFRVRRFTPAVSDLLELIDSDIGRPVTDLAPKFTDEKMLEDARKVLGNLIPVERELRSHSGRWYIRRTLPYRTAENRIEGVVITFFDVGARKRAEQQIVSAHERLEAVLEQMPLAVLIVEAAGGRLMYANRRALALLGHAIDYPIPQQEPVALPLMEGLDRGGRTYVPADWPIARCLATDEIASDDEIRVVDTDGRTRKLFVSAAPVRDGMGKTVAVVGTFSEHEGHYSYASVIVGSDR